MGNLAGGKHFSKLDLRQAYHQMEVTEESKKFLTINTHKGLFQYNNNDNNNNNNNKSNNNNDLLTYPLGGSALLNYINYNYKINRIKLFTNCAVEAGLTESNYSD